MSDAVYKTALIFGLQAIIRLLCSSVVKCLYDFRYTLFKIAFYLFPPKTQNFPTVVLKSFGYFPISFHITLYLRNPKFLSDFEIFLSMFPIVSMPKLTIANTATFFPIKAMSGCPNTDFTFFLYRKPFCHNALRSNNSISESLYLTCCIL